MSDRVKKAGRILARVRELGGNIVWDDVGHRIFIAGQWKLPAGSNKIIRDYAAEIAQILRADATGDFEERAAIIEHDGGATRQNADRLARLLFASCPAGTNPADWTWFVNKALEIMDAAPSESAA